uniref:Coiled-coil domain-containing protein 16 n=1 Tax=Parastrongyloides trichosuri TaxID=131310 RepID=A0A0N4ZX39_PARTI
MSVNNLPDFAVLLKNGFIECKICNKTSIREKLWVSHVKGAEHKKSIIKLKTTINKKSGEKRPHIANSEESIVVKKSKNEVLNNQTTVTVVPGLPADFFETSSAKCVSNLDKANDKQNESDKDYESIMDTFFDEINKDNESLKFKEIEEELDNAPERKDEREIEEILGEAIDTGTEEDMMKFWKESEEIEIEIEKKRKNGKMLENDDSDEEENWDDEEFNECDLFRGKSLF